MMIQLWQRIQVEPKFKFNDYNECQGKLQRYLTCQIEFLRSELIEMNQVIKSLINLSATAKNPTISRTEAKSHLQEDTFIEEDMLFRNKIENA